MQTGGKIRYEKSDVEIQILKHVFANNTVYGFHIGHIGEIYTKDGEIASIYHVGNNEKRMKCIRKI